LKIPFRGNKKNLFFNTLSLLADNLVKLSTTEQEHLQQEIQSFKEQAQKMRKHVHDLMQEKERYLVKSNDSASQTLQAMEEIKARDMTTLELNRKIIETEELLKKQQVFFFSLEIVFKLFLKKKKKELV